MSRSPPSACIVSCTSHRTQSIRRVSMQTRVGAVKQLGNQKTSMTVSVLQVFSRRSIDVSRRFDPVDSTEFFRRATSHCTEFAVDRFATLDYSGTLIQAAAMCQKFALHCVRIPATFPEFKDRHRDSNTPLNPLSDGDDSTISDSALQTENLHDFP